MIPLPSREDKHRNRVTCVGCTLGSTPGPRGCTVNIIQNKNEVYNTVALNVQRTSGHKVKGRMGGTAGQSALDILASSKGGAKRGGGVGGRRQPTE